MSFYQNMSNSSHHLSSNPVQYSNYLQQSSKYLCPDIVTFFTIFLTPWNHHVLWLKIENVASYKQIILKLHYIWHRLITARHCIDSNAECSKCNYSSLDDCSQSLWISTYIAILKLYIYAVVKPISEMQSFFSQLCLCVLCWNLSVIANSQIIWKQ